MYVPIVSTLTALTGLSELKAIPAQAPVTSQPADLVNIASRDTQQQPLTDLLLPTITSAKSLASGHRLYARREGGYNTPVRNAKYHYTIVVDDETLGVTPSESPALRVLEAREETPKNWPTNRVDEARYYRTHKAATGTMAKNTPTRSVVAWEYPTATAPFDIPGLTDGGWPAVPDLATATAMPTMSPGGWENFPSEASAPASTNQYSSFWNEFSSKATATAASSPDNKSSEKPPEATWRAPKNLPQEWLTRFPVGPRDNNHFFNHSHKTVSFQIPTLTGIWANVTAKSTATATDHGLSTVMSSSTSTASTTIAPWRINDWKPPAITTTLSFTADDSVVVETITYIAKRDEASATTAAAVTSTLAAKAEA
ncbi:hypothetical protein E4T42_05430 [Aureobasidium subglaciale]|nr:hypothetical protein E4T42_05430 [Aureobasidium subglaciale]